MGRSFAGRYEDETVTVEIVGAGTVGEATGIVLEEWGNEVVFKDIDEKVRKLLRNRGYRARKPSAEVGATLSLVCVPTPFDEGVGLSTDYVESAIRTLAEQDPEVVAVRSTVPPGTTRQLAETYGIEDYAVLPEFLFEDTAQEDVERSEVMVLGSDSAKAPEVIKRTFEPNVTGFIEIRPVEAELVKLVGNTFAATKISFANGMWRIADSLSSADPDVVLSAFRQVSPWMGPDMGLEGGWPYGGHCLPKDTRGLKQWMEETTGGAPPQLKGTIRENEQMRRSDYDSADVNTGTAESVHMDN